VLVPKYPNVMDAAALTAKYACKSNENFVYLKTFSVIYKFHLFQVLSNYAYVEMQCRKTSWTRTLTFFADNHRGNYSNLRCNLELENKLWMERWGERSISANGRKRLSIHLSLLFMSMSTVNEKLSVSTCLFLK